MSATATGQALRVPFQKHGIEFENKETLHAVTAESQCYPYFIQLLGEALGEVLDRNRVSTITDAQVTEAIKPFQQRKGAFYGRRYNEIEDRDLLAFTRPVAQIVQYHQTHRLTLSRVALRGNLQDNVAFTPEQIKAGIKTLETLGFLWRPDTRHIEPGIPGLMQYVIRHTETPTSLKPKQLPLEDKGTRHCSCKGHD